MADSSSLISTVAIGLSAAFVGGCLVVRLGLPPLVGYLLAGIVVGPYTPGFVADSKLSSELADIGVILMMFGVGMHFSLADLLAVRHIAIPGAIGQMLIATLMGAGLAALWGWPFNKGLIFGLSLSVASTVVLLRTLESRGILETKNGRIAVGWLIVEDLVLILALVLLPVLATADDNPVSFGEMVVNIAKTFGLVGLFITSMLVFGKRVFPWILNQVERKGSRELFTLAVIALSLGVAFGAYKLLGVKPALAAFFAGMVVHESELSNRAEKELKPLQDMFAALFFVSVGMLFNPQILLHQPLQVLAVVSVIMIGKSIAAIIVVKVLRYPWHTALVVSAALAQIGEFSFILAGLGVSLGLLSIQSQGLIVAGALISITLNPLAFFLVDKYLDQASVPENVAPASAGIQP